MLFSIIVESVVSREYSEIKVLVTQNTVTKNEAEMEDRSQDDESASLTLQFQRSRSS